MMVSLKGPYIYVLLFLSTFAITYIYRKWAVRKSILDIPSERSSHDIPTPRGGGIAFFISFYAGLGYAYFTGQIESRLLLALAPGILIAITGFIEDIRIISMNIRLVIHFMCAGFSIYAIGGIDNFLGFSSLYFWNLIALFGLVWFINLFNFLDGTDGYASMEAITVTLALFLLTGEIPMLILAFSVGGFLYWNWPKAKIFMGDAGSTTLGFIIGIFGIYLHNQDKLQIHLWLIITALFWFDASITLIRRIKNKENLSKPHRNHIYQRAVTGGFSHLEVMLWGIVINIILFLLCFLIIKNILWASVGFVAAGLVLVIILAYVDKKCPYQNPFGKSG